MCVRQLDLTMSERPNSLIHRPPFSINQNSRTTNAMLPANKVCRPATELVLEFDFLLDEAGIDQAIASAVAVSGLCRLTTVNTAAAFAQ